MKELVIPIKVDAVLAIEELKEFKADVLQLADQAESFANAHHDEFCGGSDFRRCNGDCIGVGDLIDRIRKRLGK